ncbi:unnamed protein product [Urochloa decumbens]|uniref:Late embryogenesis abundant protein LEA-2 subgroup domain-containing protein n=1 Tax=Urochloa decumbens TaxID=240449 RepID=A0ABC9FUF4_9POAL
MAGGPREAAQCCCGFILGALAIAGILVAAYGFVTPVRVTVDAASLGSLALAAVSSPANGTTASFAYDVSLAVTVRNPNWAMCASLTAPLVAELRFRGHAFATAQLAAAGGQDRIPAMRTAVYGMAGVAQSAPVALGPRGAAAFARERAAGVFHLVLAVSGQVKYDGHRRRRAIKVTCPLRISTSSTAALARVRCA